jgi:FkbM family methyltransferase
LTSLLEWQLWAFGGYERHFAALFSSLVGPGDQCVDVGANVGVHTVRLAKLAGRGGSVIAIEPEPSLADRARRNIELNGLANAHVVNAAASDKSGHTVLYRPGAFDTNRARASLLCHPYLTGAAVTVPVVTVDEVSDGPVTLIKIDVEGHEAAVVRGAAKIIERDVPTVLFEYAPQLLDDASRTPFGWLKEQGYEMFRADCARNRVTGRGRLVLEPVSRPPAVRTDILALPSSRRPQLRGLVG